MEKRFYNFQQRPRCSQGVGSSCHGGAHQRHAVGVGRACVLEALVHADLILLVRHAQADGGDHHAGFFGGFRPYMDGAHAETVASRLEYWGYIVGTIDRMEPIRSGVAIGSIDDMGRHHADERSWRNREEKSPAL